MPDDTDWRQLDDPGRDGWETELFNERAQEQLDRLGVLLANERPLNAEQLQELADAEVVSQDLVPNRWREAYRDEAFAVAEPDWVPNQEAAAKGRAALAAQLSRWAEAFSPGGDLKTKFKIVRVVPTADGQAVDTRVLGAISGRLHDSAPAAPDKDSTAMLERHFAWEVRWAERADGPPLIQGIEVVELEQVAANLPRGMLFSDCTASALAHNECYKSQLLVGLDGWLERTQDMDSFGILGSPGIALGDVDGDGLEDVYLCQEGGLPNRLFLQQANGMVKEVAATTGVDWLHRSRCALFVDIDNDGDQDLVVALLGSILLAANDGGGRFEVREVLPCDDDTMSLSSADYDADGRLDIYICVYNPPDQSLDADGESLAALTSRIVYHDATGAGRNSLFRNETTGGAWRFRDVTAETGLDVNNRRYSFAAAWEDYDNDGDADLYVANDFGRNNLYRNEFAETGTHRFTDVAAEAGAEDSASGMSVTWGDYNRDGWMDIYVSNMFSSAGSRIAHQAQFKPDTSALIKERLQRFARGNTLLANRGDGTFQDVSEAAGVTMGRWAWSSNFADLNNDGWDDLLVANGFITGDDTGDL